MDNEDNNENQGIQDNQDNVVQFPSVDEVDPHDEYLCDECGCDSFNIVILDGIELIVVCTECFNVCEVQELVE